MAGNSAIVLVVRVCARGLRVNHFARRGPQAIVLSAVMEGDVRDFTYELHYVLQYFTDRR